MGEFIEIAHEDGQKQSAYAALPPSGYGPGLLILGEIYNVNGWVRAVAEKYAAEGFVAVAPDLFWRDEPNVYLDYTPENQLKGRQFYARMSADQAAKDLDVAIRYLRANQHVTGKISVLGFCLGGQLAVLAGTRSTPDAIIAYYGTDLHKYADEIGGLRAPALFHFGSEDKLIPIEIAEDIAYRTAGRSDVAVHIYEGAGHGFARFSHPPHHPEAEALSVQRNLALLRSL